MIEVERVGEALNKLVRFSLSECINLEQKSDMTNLQFEFESRVATIMSLGHV